MAESVVDGHLIEHRTGGRMLLSGGFLEVRRDDVRLPDGSTATREFVQHPGAVAIIPLLDDGRRVLVRQHRYPVAKVLLEWPAGKLDAGEDPLHCAMRELREETGYSARQWALAGDIHNAAAYSSETIRLYFARGLVAGNQVPDVGEFVETVCLTEAQLLALDLRGELPDVKTLVGLLWLQQLHSGQRSCDWIDVPSGTAHDVPSRLP
ncbi:MAG: NUDIX hydrolase [Rubrivivax sp.]|nr:NUDIX hydrolase [Rubrivivax sp.]